MSVIDAPAAVLGDLVFLVAWFSHLLFEAVSGRNHSQTCSGCIVLKTTESSLSLSASITLHAEVAVATYHFPTRERTPTTPTRHLISPLRPR
jgi:hypothetical protein